MKILDDYESKAQKENGLGLFSGLKKLLLVVLSLTALWIFFVLPTQNTSSGITTLVSELRNAKAAGNLWIASSDLKGEDLAVAWKALNSDKTSFNEYMDNPNKAEELLFFISCSGDLLIGKQEKDMKKAARAISMQPTILFDASGNAVTADTARLGIFMRVK